MWLRHFGQPLVPTVFDFGHAGKPPTHPELLDWLAVELVEAGWSMKHLHRLMVTSQTYRLSSSNAGHQANRALDADNRFLWRMNPRRMEAELVRDSLLHVAGQLDQTLGGRTFRRSAASRFIGGASISTIPASTSCSSSAFSTAPA